MGPAGRDDHGPQKERTRKAKLPSSPEEEADGYESVEGDGDEAGRDSSGSEDDDDDGSNDGNEEVADADGDDDGEEEEEENDEEEEEEEEEEGAEGRRPHASPLPNRSKTPNLEAGTPSLPGPVDEDDAATMDVQLGTIHLAQASTLREASGARGASAPPSERDRSPQACSNGSVPQPLKRSLGYVLLMILLFALSPIGRPRE